MGTGFSRAYLRLVDGLVAASAALAGAGIVTMMAVTTADVVLRAAGAPLAGAYDVVTIAGCIALACALPYTAAVKGHVAVQYFVQALGRTGSAIVETAMRLLAVTLFAVLAYRSALYGYRLAQVGEVTPTLRIPMFWMPYVIAFACGVVTLVLMAPTGAREDRGGAA